MRGRAQSSRRRVTLETPSTDARERADEHDRRGEPSIARIIQRAHQHGCPASGAGVRDRRAQPVTEIPRCREGSTRARTATHGDEAPAHFKKQGVSRTRDGEIVR